MKVIIAGSRTLNPNDEEIDLSVTLLTGSPHSKVEVVCGMAEGVDLAGKRWAIKESQPLTEYPADWKAHGKKAGILRNENMGNYADGAVFFWDGSSPGTHHMIGYMQKLNKPFVIKRY